MKNRIRRLDQDLDSFRGNIYRVSITNVDDMYGVILYKVGKCFAFLLPWNMISCLCTIILISDDILLLAWMGKCSRFEFGYKMHYFHCFIWIKFSMMTKICIHSSKKDMSVRSIVLSCLLSSSFNKFQFYTVEFLNAYKFSKKNLSSDLVWNILLLKHSDMFRNAKIP